MKKHRGMRVLNNFDLLETWKPILNNSFDHDKDRIFSIHVMFLVCLLGIFLP